MNRPGTIEIHAYVAALDMRLRDEVRRTKRFVVPERLKHPIRSLKTMARPLLQSGAMVLTALSVIIAIGVAPAIVPHPEQTAAPLAAPTVSEEVIAFADRLPVDDLLAIQIADNRDTLALLIE